MNELVSIIVPIYNVEKYLEQCIDSILNQSYKNLEIILVDDGSPDNCGKICDRYAKSDKRIKVIHKKNGGLSEARNFGLDIARGEYIVFVDSDDYINVHMIKILLENIKKYSTDIVICNFNCFENINVVERNLSKNIKIGIYNNIDIIKEYFLSSPMELVVAWNKIYKRKLFDKDTYFPINRLYEDLATSYKLYFKAQKICILDNRLYYYRKRDNSITNSISKKNIEDLISTIKESYILAKNYKLDLDKEVGQYIINMYYGLIILLYDNNLLDDSKCFIDDLNHFIKQHVNINDIIKLKNIKVVIKYLFIIINKVQYLEKCKIYIINKMKNIL